MKIQKRDGSLEQLSFDKIIYRLRKLCNDESLGLLKSIDPDVIAQRVVSSIYDGVTSCELDEEAARIAVSMTENMDYQKLASRITISNLHKSTIECFSEVMETLYNNTDKNEKHMPIIAEDVIEIIRDNKNTLNFAIDYKRDYMFDFFGYKTLEKSYLLKIYNKTLQKMIVVERPQHLYMRVAIGIHKEDIESAIKTYNLISQHFYTHASPTMFNGGTPSGNLSSCFLMNSTDSIEGIFKTLTDCAKISKVGGGIGLHVTNIRAKGSLIRGTNGLSDGIVPLMKMYNSTASYINQCVTPDTVVYSKDGFKRMDEITTQDELVTKDGTYKKVNEVIVNQKQEVIYEISNYASIDPLKCTKEHDIFVIKTSSSKRDYKAQVMERLQKGTLKAEFIPANEIQERYYMGYPIPQHECDIETFSLDQCRMYGIMLGDGSVINSVTSNAKRYQVTLNNNKKLVTKAFVLEFLNKHNIHYWIMNDCEICFTYNTVSIGKMGITEEMLYDKEKHKRMDTRFLHLPKQKAAMLMKGLLESDGCKTSTGLWFTSTDKNLIYSLKYLFLRFGVLTSCQTVDKVGQTMNYNKKGKPIISRKISYQLRIPKLKVIQDFDIKTDFDLQSSVNFFEFDKILYTRITKINKIEYKGDVYDFNMIDNHNYLTDMGLVHNSGKRKGSFAMYLEPWHADVLEFLDMKRPQGHEDMRARDLFYALWVPDLFMKQVENDGDWYLMCPDECPGLPDAYGDEFEELYWKYVKEKRYKRVVKAQEVWKKVLESQIETGVPYIGYKDSVNKKCNQKNLGTIKSSNLCVAPETMILTSKGYYKIEKLENQEVQIWNGQEWSTTVVRKTGEDQELLKVRLSNGSELECTHYHKFYVAKGKRPSEYPILTKIDAKDLEPGMKLIKSEFPIIDNGPSDFPYPYEHGLFSADGTMEHSRQKGKNERCRCKALEGEKYCGRHKKIYLEEGEPSEFCQALIGNGFARITLYGEKKNLLPYISSRLDVHTEDSNNRIHVRLPLEVKDKYIVPINYNMNTKLRWFEGVCDGDGCILRSDGLTGIQIASIHEQFLQDIRFMLQTMGCDPKIVHAADAGNGKGGSGQYMCKRLYRLLITSHDAATLYNIGFRPKRLILSGVYPKNNTKRWTQVQEVVQTNRISDTYCFTEDKRGMGVFNGVLTGQCMEISLYSDDKQYAVCNLCSIALPKFVDYDFEGKPFFDFEKLREVAEYTIIPMNKVIDNNKYPTPETKNTNLAHRPLGIGAQGLADVYFKMKLPYDSLEAKQLNKDIFETIYYGTMKGSIELAKKDGHYSSFPGSPFSEGKLQFDLAAEFDGLNVEKMLSGRWDWASLKEDLKKYGTRNSMLMALMPTASSAQIMGNSEAFEAVDSVIFKRRVLSGEYMVINKYLVEELGKMGLWSNEMKERIISNNGSIQGIDEIPLDIKAVYKTVWEISMKTIIEQCSDRGVYVDQMQSMNLFMANPTYKKLTSMHFYCWRLRNKTGCYYLRSKASSSSGKFSVDVNLEKQIRDKQAKGEVLEKEEEILLCSIDNKEECMACSS